MGQTEALSLRRAVAADEAQLFEWRNLDWVVVLGASGRQVTPEEHAQWFQGTLRGDQCLLLIVEIDGSPAGVIRFDAEADDCVETSLYLMPAHTGRGVGSAVFASALSYLGDWRGKTRITARVLRANERSQRFFERMGFQRDDARDDADTVHFIRRWVTVPHSRPFVGAAEGAAAARVVTSGYLAHGKEARRVERLWCEKTGAAQAACVASGVGALRLALLGLGVGLGDVVIVPAYSCVALMNAVLALGGTPILADVEPDSWVLSVDDVAARITPVVKAIIAVNLFGMPAPVEALRALGPAVVENCAHGIGGQHRDGTLFGGAGDVSISSFYATKMICGGEGGIVAAGDGAIIDRVCKARDYGDQAPDGRHLNDKMTDVEAAIVYEQLCSLENICSRRRERAERYAVLLQPLAEAGRLVGPPTCDGRIWYRYPICLTNQSAAVLCGRMSTAGVAALQPVWDLRGTEAWVEALPGTTRAFDHVLSLPLYPDLTELEQETVVAALAYCLNTV